MSKNLKFSKLVSARVPQSAYIRGIKGEGKTFFVETLLAVRKYEAMRTKKTKFMCHKVLELHPNEESVYSDMDHEAVELMRVAHDYQKDLEKKKVFIFLGELDTVIMNIKTKEQDEALSKLFSAIEGALGFEGVETTLFITSTYNLDYEDYLKKNNGGSLCSSYDMLKKCDRMWSIIEKNHYRANMLKKTMSKDDVKKGLISKYGYC